MAMQEAVNQGLSHIPGPDKPNHLISEHLLPPLRFNFRRSSTHGSIWIPRSVASNPSIIKGFIEN
jgi:hypothetical protein